MPAKRLDRTDVVTAALALTARDGLDALTMRALAQELGVSTMATYRYVKTKQDLIDLVLDEVLAEVRSIASDGGWRDLLHRRAVGYLEVVRRYPGVEAAFRVNSVTDYERNAIREQRALLRSIGLREPVLTNAWDLYQSFMFGHFALEAQRGRGKARDEAAFLWGLDQIFDVIEAAAGKLES